MLPFPRCSCTWRAHHQRANVIQHIRVHTHRRHRRREKAHIAEREELREEYIVDRGSFTLGSSLRGRDIGLPHSTLPVHYSLPRARSALIRRRCARGLLYICLPSLSLTYLLILSCARADAHTHKPILLFQRAQKNSIYSSRCTHNRTC